ncbi:GNAT family N-acetyltransferase [Phycicoccus sp. BSK3Z-2]|uniref:GNAT family N-acetyltransferase n=1 Tax=Phycicoccus avicenniae TaxID=2828860 RepID=A0A941DD40_9MICO|nr:GNAT family N-acetyltransferase [Phycicoccus avicenniae]MBR7744132.1 GNAT family N-acetyltransferase [Phycicoccus avicenniae]
MDLLTTRPRWAGLVGPGIWTDLVVSSLTGSEVHDEGDHLRVVTPDNPTFRWGNYLDVLDPDRADDVDLWLRRFERAFPHARHRTVGLPGPVAPAWTERGFEPDVVVTLLADGPVREVPLPEGYVVRELGREAAWSDAVGLVATHDDGSESAQEHRVFLERQADARRRAVEAGHAWFALVTHGDTPVAHLGIVRCGPVGRFQSVLTHPDHRGRGLAGHLVGRAAAWVRAHGAQGLVIVTEEHNPAGRLYRSLGFDGTELSYGVSVPDVDRLA